MPFYNLAAEYASFFIICISMGSFLLDSNKGSTRYSALKWMYITTFCSIIITIVSLLSTDYYQHVPLIITDIFKYLYFFTASIAAPMMLVYSITLTQYKNYKFNFLKQYVWAWLPYVIYLIFIITNFMHRLVFTISPTEGYIRGEYFRITYVIAILYILLTIFYIIKHLKTPQRGALLIVALNLFVSTCVFCAQLIVPSIQLSGLASLCGILILHFYVQNISKTRDPLTELNNRQFLTTQITKMCKSKSPFHMFVFSIKNFKGVNERNGLAVGDAILEQFALRLRECYSAKYLYRYSGDEFALILPGNNKEVLDNVDFLYQELSKPYITNETITTLDLVIARVDYPEFGESNRELISVMDYSIKIIKKDQGNSYYINDVSICNSMKRRHYIIEKLNHAILDDGFEVHYQPIYSIKEKNFPYAEALIRFKDSGDSYISPGEFIPIAEETGLILKITSILIRLVCADYRDMIDKFGDKIKTNSVSINVPFIWLSQKQSLDEILAVLDEYDLDPSMIRIEITERTFANDLEQIVRTMNEFIEKGFVFELDDFGVEYANLGMFFNVPVDVIKFDRVIVKDSNLNQERRDFFKALVLTVKKANVSIIMEGVEDQELLDFLAECSEEYIQGYVFSKPLPLKEYCTFIAEKYREEKSR